MHIIDNKCEFSLDGDREELLNKTTEPMRAFYVYDFRGKKIKPKMRCELCAFCEIVEDSDSFDLLCLRKSQIVDDNHKCDDFNITRGMLDDIYHGCIK